jgi:tetratricopeptide (TPR) repeat protein
MERKSILIAVLGFLLIPVLLASPALSQSKKDRDQAKKFEDEADKKVTAKSYDEAVTLYAQSVQLVPNNARAHYRKGFAHYSLKQYDQAINSLTTALNQGYRALDIYRIRYFVYMEQGNFDAALADAEKGLALVPNDFNFLNAIGSIQYARKNYPAALEAYKKAATVSSNPGDVYYNIARVNLGLNDAQAQAAAAQTALDKGTTYPGETFFLLGDAHYKLKNNPAAIDAYKRTLGVKKDIYQVYQNLAELYKTESRWNEAIETLRSGLAQYPLDGNFYTELGLLYSLAGRPEEAVAASRSGVQALPDQAPGYTNLCRALNETKDYRGAVDACNNSLRIRPNDGETYFYLGNAYALMDRPTEATRAYSNAVKGLVEATNKNPGQTDLWYLLGNSYFADKQFDKAIEAYLKCLEISPKFVKARANLGIAYTRKKNKAAATEQYNLLVAVDAGLAARVKAEIDRM